MASLIILWNNHHLGSENKVNLKERKVNFNNYRKKNSENKIILGRFKIQLSVVASLLVVKVGWLSNIA